MPSFLPWDALAGLYCSCLQSLFVCGSVCVHFIFSQLKSGDWLSRLGTVHFFAFRLSWAAFTVCFGPLSVLSLVQTESVISLISINISSLAVEHVHAITLSSVFDRWCLVSITSPSFLSPFLLVILVPVNLRFVCLKNPVPDLSVYEGLPVVYILK